MTGNLDDILQELKRGLEAIYGPRLKGLYLYGSRARGDAEEDSDIDVAMVLDDFASSGEERRRVADTRWALSLGHDCVLTCVPIRERDWSAHPTLFLSNVRREGVLVG